MVQFYYNGTKVSHDYINKFVQGFQINGYRDVPMSNVLGYANLFANISEARQVGPRSWEMIRSMKANGYDWKQ